MESIQFGYFRGNYDVSHNTGFKSKEHYVKFELELSPKDVLLSYLMEVSENSPNLYRWRDESLSSLFKLSLPLFAKYQIMLQ